MRVQLSLSFHCYLLYLLLNSCDRNDAFWHHYVLVKQSISFSWKHRTSSLQICVRQTVRLTTEFMDWCRNVCTLYKHLSAIPAAVTSDLKQRLVDTSASISQNWKRHRQSNSTQFICDIKKWRKQRRKRLHASMKAKWHYFEHLLN